jgi:hypothetical protein
MRPASTPQAAEPERTASGLTRRVPGAHLPTTGPVIMRRGAQRDARPNGRPGGADGPPAARPPQASPPVTLPPSLGGSAGDGPATPGQERAESVYTLLTSFAVGVQRGLDEAGAEQSRPSDT